MSKKLKNNAISRSITDSFSMINSNKAIVCKDQCMNMQKILLQVLNETKMSSRDVKNLKFAHDLLDNVVTQLSSCVPWHERMAYERLKKRQEIKNKCAGENVNDENSVPEKTKISTKKKKCNEGRHPQTRGRSRSKFDNSQDEGRAQGFFTRRK